MRKIDRKTIVVLSIGIIMVVIILIGTLDILFGNGVLGLLLYGIVLASIYGGIIHGSNIDTGLGLVSRHKRHNLPQSRGKPPLAFTINKDPKEIRHGNRKRRDSYQSKRGQ
ncbi:MAG: hypothetical protein ACXADY_21410 [Candidatus Hodarchaeales archaeon]